MERQSCDYNEKTNDNQIKCSPCIFGGKTIDAVKWCTNCMEGLCKGCIEDHQRNVALKHHVTIPVVEYPVSLTSPSFETNMICKNHKREFEMFCPVHDSAVCSICVEKFHPQCKNMVTLKDIATHSKSAGILYDLEKSLSDADQNIENAIQSMVENKTSLILSKSIIHQDIKIVRREITQYIDKLETELLQKLEDEYKKCIRNIDLSIANFKIYKKNINSFISANEGIKHARSDIQCFLEIRNTDRKFARAKVPIDKQLKANTKYEMSILFDPIIKSFKAKVAELGKLHVEISPHTLMIQDFKMRQAQIPVQVANRSHHDYDNLERIQEIPILPNLQDHIITSCMILPKSRFLFIHRNYDKLFVQDHKGSVQSTLSIASGPYDADLIDENSLAISYGSLARVEIINLNNGEVLKKIPTRGFCSGICYGNGNVYVVVKNKGICVISQTGNMSCLIRIPSLDMGHIAMTTDRLIYTDTKNKSVHCCNLQGGEVWKILVNDASPRGIQFDKHGNVLYTDSKSQCLKLLSADGENNRVLLSSSDGMNNPFGMHYDKHTNQLLLCNLLDGRAFLYQYR
jgi:predicted amino acid-binding ACT domain protein